MYKSLVPRVGMIRSASGRRGHVRFPFESKMGNNDVTQFGDAKMGCLNEGEYLPERDVEGAYPLR